MSALDIWRKGVPFPKWIRPLSAVETQWEHLYVTFKMSIITKGREADLQW